MNGCIPLSPASSVPARGPISGADAGRWDVTSAAVVSGLECYRLTIGTTEHSVIGHSDRGIPSSGAFFPRAALSSAPLPLVWTGELRLLARLPAEQLLCSASPRFAGELVRNKKRNAGIRLVTLVPLSCPPCATTLLPFFFLFWCRFPNGAME